MHFFTPLPPKGGRGVHSCGCARRTFGPAFGPVVQADEFGEQGLAFGCERVAVVDESDDVRIAQFGETRVQDCRADVAAGGAEVAEIQRLAA